jgi:CHAD domain-containing protein
MATNATETELKYEIPDGASLPALDRLPMVARTSGGDDQLEAEYYDTSDLRLLRAGITLRRRVGGGDAGWHLKLPAGPATRTEIRLPPGRARGTVPAELAGLVRAYVRDGKLRPVASMLTRRQRVMLLDESGSSLAEVAADEVSAHTMGDATTASRWREVEIELTGGDQDLLAAADKALRGGGLRPAGRSAKLERALGLDLAKRDGRSRLTPFSPARDVVLDYLRRQAGKLKALDPQVRRDQPDAVHQMRVTTRRLRAALQSFGPVLSWSATGELVDELRWLGRVLGDARDVEVLAEHLADALDQFPVEQIVGPVRARVQGHYAPQRAAARTAVLAALDSQRYFSLLDDLDQLIADPPASVAGVRPARAVLPRAVRRAYRRTRKRMQAAAQQAQEGAAAEKALHEARKAAKRARYAGEAVTPALGAEAGRLTRQLKEIQSVLGDHQDTVIARQAERELGISAHLAGENAFTYGLLYERDACAAQRLRAAAWQAWRKASRRRYREWLI